MSKHRILTGDVLETSKRIKEGSIHAVVTSPPYYGQRKYGDSGYTELGREESPDEYAQRLALYLDSLFDLVRDDGTLWLNIGDTIKNGVCLGLPWRVIGCLQKWLCVGEIVFHKSDPIPSSATKRPVRAHEFVFMLAKSKDYFYDPVAIMEPNSTGDGTSNARSVWRLSTESSKVAHGAVMPQGLIQRCIQAATSENGNCGKCGAPYLRQVKKTRKATRPAKDNKFTESSAKVGKRDTGRNVTAVETVGWQKQCKCSGASRVPATILDPFAGSGSTAVACKAMGLNSVSCELYPEYVAMIKQRLKEGK